MAAALSEGEFHRMQLQLIELRTANYELEGKYKKVERESLEAQEKIETLERELGKAKQAINKSKKTKDVEILLQESDSLQRKLLSQEEEFRLQNQTLMAELALLVSNNEELKKEVEKLKENTTPSESIGEKAEDSDELRRLQAENAVLQKNLNALQEKYEKDISAQLKDEQTSSKEATDPVNSDAGKDHLEEEGAENVDMQDGPSIAELKLQLDTEREEKRLLKSQLDQKQKENKEQIATLQDELGKANDKLKKKQESYLQLHGEKEQLFENGSVKLEESQAARDRDQKFYKDQIAKLQQEIEKHKREVEQHQTSVDKETEDLKHRLAELQKQVDISGMVASHQLQEQSAKYLAEITMIRDNHARVTKERDDLLAQLQESQRVAEEAMSNLQAAQTERDSQITAVQELSKVAEKRKSLLDELAIKYQKEYDAHRENISQMEIKHQEEVDLLQSNIDEQKKKITELNKQVPMIDELTKKVQSLEDTKGWLERRLSEVEEELSATVVSNEKERENLIMAHTSEIETLIAKHEEEIEQLKQEKQQTEEDAKSREAALIEELETLKNKAENLKQEIKDTEDEKKIHEKKGMTMLKDLKRQLHAERKRAEKLQLKLQEVLSEGHNKNMEDLFKSPDSDPQTGDASSVSSWGAGASGLGKDSVASGPQSPMSGNNSFVSETSVGDEYSDLLKRIGVLQQEKWALEEKVNHLEMSNACMAEDILNKTSIIEHYVMESRTGPKPSSTTDEKISLKKVMDLVNKNSEHTQHTQDMNKKLQCMLEETLTKNMHLQQDLEFMSQEVVRLSKLSATVTTANASLDQPAKEMHPPTSLTLASTTALSVEDKVTFSDNDGSSLEQQEPSPVSDENMR